MDKSLELLKKYFGYESFRIGQEEIIENILKGKDVLAIMPTGGGKSICYQIPALVMDGCALVISPLISLMKDQVDTLKELGIAAAFINSSLSLKELNGIIRDAENNLFKLLYVAPERLESENFLELLKNINISMVAVDEAHCVSQWGHDFRPSYLKINNLRFVNDKKIPIAAFTATATPSVKEDIINLIRLQNHYELITGFDRENLKFEVARPTKKADYLLNYVKENKSKSGVIYCLTRKLTDEVCEKLNKAGHKAVKYHAGLSDKERIKNQEDFLYDNSDIIVATNAFGMGIDKSNIRYVIHYNMPKNIESYYQEAGRAGRDGENSECILLFSTQDIVMNNFLIENSMDSNTKASEYAKLRDMINYCNTDKCLRKYLISYFDDGYNKDNCHNCGNCLNQIESQNITVESQKILSCIYRMGERFGGNVVIDVLKGSSNQRIRNLKFDKLSTYGIMKEYGKDTLKEIIDYLISDGFILIEGDKFPVLKISQSGNAVLRGKLEVLIKKAITKNKEQTKSKEYDNGLFNELKALRKEIAEELKVPPFIVFSDASLKDMCIKFPLNKKEMLNVSGVGEFKAERYAEKFISAIKNYAEKNNIEVENSNNKSCDKSEIDVEQAIYAADENSSEENIRIKDIKDKKEKSEKSEKSEKEDTRSITYKLYLEGKPLDEIAKLRNLSQNTVEEHLIYCAKLGMKLDYSNFVSDNNAELIIEAYKKIGGDKLKPIKEVLPDYITYTEIKFALCKYKEVDTPLE